MLVCHCGQNLISHSNGSVESKMMVMELTEPAKPRTASTTSISSNADKTEKPAPRRRCEKLQQIFRNRDAHLNIQYTGPLFDSRFSHAGLVILPQKQNPDDLFLGPRYEENALVSNIYEISSNWISNPPGMPPCPRQAPPERSIAVESRSTTT